MESITFHQRWWQDSRNTYLFNPFLCFVVIVSFLVLFKPKRNNNKQNLPPSPPALPIIGNLHQIRNSPHKSFRSLSEKYGPLMLVHLGNVPAVVVSSAEIAREIAKNHDIVFSDRPSLTSVGIVFKGCLDMVFGPYCDHSREAKKLCVQLLSDKRVQQFHSIIEEQVGKVVENIRLLGINGAPVNLNAIFASLAHDILSKSAFGSLLDNQKGKYKSFGELARKTMTTLPAFCFKDLFPYLGWIDHLTGLIGNLKIITEDLNEFFDWVIKEREALMNNNEKAEDKKYLVDILLHLRKESLKLDLSKDNVKAILLDMFVGGTDTSAATMEWMMTELLKNPRIMKKTQEEVRRIVGNSKSKITDSDISQMEYLKCVMKETVRFHASAMIPRQTSSHVKLRGYDIPAKTRVLINLWAIQRDPKLWDRPEEFLPERFLRSSVDSDEEHRKLLFSFGTGKRACPGMAYAHAEIEYAMANLLYWFDWELPNGERCEDLDTSEVYTFLIQKKTPLWAVAHPYYP